MNKKKSQESKLAIFTHFTVSSSEIFTDTCTLTIITINEILAKAAFEKQQLSNM